jgi:hypothetical protein
LGDLREDAVVYATIAGAGAVAELGIVNSLAAAMGGSSGRLRRLQNGFVRSYALFMFLGAVLLVGTLLAVRI